MPQIISYTHMANTKTNTQKTSKSGYEIRLEVLQAAIGLTDARWHLLNDVQRQENEAKLKIGINTTFKMVEDNRVEESLAIAEKLYKFVEGK